MEFAVVIGIIVGFASSLMVPIFHEKLKIDDAFYIGAVHGVSGILGSLLVGVFANSVVNHLGINGWLYMAILISVNLKLLELVLQY